MEKIKRYYQLCGVKSPEERPVPIVNLINEKALEDIFTRKHVELFFRRTDNVYKLRETVIGGGILQRDVNNNNNNNRYNREKIIIVG